MSHAHDSHHHGHDGSTERRFVPAPTSRSGFISLAGGLGAAALGAGFFGQWIHEPPLESGPFMLAVGAAGIAIATFVGDPGSAPIRVGRSGVGIERGGAQPDRLAWCDVEKVWLVDDELVAEGGGHRIVAGLAHHGAAACWIVHEALVRIPKRVSLTEAERSRLARTTEDGGEIVKLEPLQVAGRRCKASDKLISFEDDAVVCERCAQVYHKDHVPGRCLSCDAEMAARAESA